MLATRSPFPQELQASLMYVFILYYICQTPKAVPWIHEFLGQLFTSCQGLRQLYWLKPTPWGNKKTDWKNPWNPPSNCRQGLTWGKDRGRVVSTCKNFLESSLANVTKEESCKVTENVQSPAVIGTWDLQDHLWRLGFTQSFLGGKAVLSAKANQTRLLLFSCF